MIITLIWLIFSLLMVVIILIEKYVESHNNTFTKWWRTHIISEYPFDDDL
jgi:hypothetical protein